MSLRMHSIETNARRMFQTLTTSIELIQLIPSALLVEARAGTSDTGTCTKTSKRTGNQTVDIAIIQNIGEHEFMSFNSLRASADF